jgi:hypothetical protein|uniref:Uncharacterized protein n=1 Tax=viral metagenome TaxID=1070528 RepID=A0A6C0DKE3_9ZZZZ
MYFYNNNNTFTKTLAKMTRFFTLKKQMNRILIIIVIASTINIIFNVTVYYKVNRIYTLLSEIDNKLELEKQKKQK